MYIKEQNCVMNHAGSMMKKGKMLRIATYGAGRDYENFLLLMKSNKLVYDDKIVLLVDGDQTKWGQLRGDLLINSPAKLKEVPIDAVVITSLKYAFEIENILRKEYPELKYYTIGAYREKKTIEYHYQINLLRNKKRKDYSFEEFDDKSIVIYTAIIGDYDELHDPLYVDQGVDYVCFTDQENITSDIWQIKSIEYSGDLDRRLLTRQYKLMPHRFLPQYNTSVWMDASMQIIGSILELIHEYQVSSDMLFFPHEGTCIYDITLGEQYREKKQVLLQQMVTYYEKGYPLDNGIIAGGFLARNHNLKTVISVMEEWYSQTELFSKRDQLSLPYALWRQNTPYDLICDYMYHNRYFKVYDHKPLSYLKRDVRREW